MDINVHVNIYMNHEDKEGLKANLSEILNQLVGQFKPNVFLNPPKTEERKEQEVIPVSDKQQEPENSQEETPKNRYIKQKSLSLDHDTVEILVDEYDKVISQSSKTGSAAIKETLKNLGLTCSEYVARRALFHHKDIPGYEDIPEPMKTFTRASTEDPNIRAIVEEIKFLRDRKNADLTTIIRLTGQEALWTRRVYDGYTYADICVTRENLMVFEERYKDMPIRPKPMKLD